MVEKKKTVQQEKINESTEAMVDENLAKPAEDNFQAVEMEQLQNTDSVNNNSTDLETILDIFVSLSVEIGQARISIRDLLQLNSGSIVKLDRAAGKPLDVMINNTLIAHGEVVVANEKYGIRLTDIVNAKERVKRL